MPWRPGDARNLAIHILAFRSFDERISILMHLSSYLMIAALVLMGLQLAYAFYQLASFIL